MFSSIAVVSRRFLGGVLLLLLASHASAKAPSIYQLAAPDAVWDVDAEDLDGDGLLEIFALVCDSKTYPYRKTVLLFEPDGVGGYHLAPSQSISLPERTGVVFFSEQTGAPPRELVAAHAEGATVYTVSKEGFEMWKEVEFHSILPTQSREPKFLKKFSVDMDRDGVEEWLLPTPSGHQLFTHAGWKATLPSPMASEMRSGDSAYITHRIPVHETFELDEDGPLGIAFASDEFVDVSHGPGWQEHWRFEVPHKLEEKWEGTVRMSDINKDNFPDLMVTQTQGTIRLESRTQIFISEGPFKYPQTPTAEFTAKGATTSPALADVDGDGFLDIIVIRIPFGPGNIINLLVRGKVSVELEIYTFDGARFSEKPTFTTTITMDAPDGREEVAYSVGDFNNDGRLDIAYAQSANVLAIHQGDPRQFLTNKPWLKLNLPSFGVARTFKLDGPGSDDIILFHPTGEHTKRIDVILFD